ncbi:M14 family metallopeptidase [Pontibacter chitinilyticus]|uniref:M14 family metallopeptidase n=1 Tax=Pontibacter chitinilyticus TaxID=2674989 RepID=UPI003219B0B7
MTSLNNQHQRPHIAVALQAFDHYAAYREPALRHRRFKHSDIVPLLERLKQQPLFEVQEVGRSVEQRTIYMVKAGQGPTKIMLWSQMHGDEPTATMALFDLFNFLQQSDQLDPVRRQILEQTTLYIVPMLNPDGAEKYKRRNALEIDLNRDALRLRSPEARLLKNLCDSLQPAFGFNLHDQSPLYTAGASSKPATISFLAPAYDEAQTVNTVRKSAMQVIAGMDAALQQLIPGQVAKFSDEHEPRAFGDNIQKWGTSVILIESGGYHGDPEKQYIRQLNFAAIVSALHLFTEESYTKYTVEAYNSIPINKPHLFDLVIRQVRYTQAGHTVLLDVGINREEVNAPNAKEFYHRSTVQEIGDMRIFHGYEEIDGEGLLLEPGNVCPTLFASIDAITTEQALDLLRAGYTTVRVASLPPADQDPLQLPFNVTSLAAEADHRLHMEGGANFILKSADGQIRYVIVNGFVYGAQTTELPALFHGLIL